MKDSELGGITEVTVHESVSVTWQRKTRCTQTSGAQIGGDSALPETCGQFLETLLSRRVEGALGQGCC